MSRSRALWSATLAIALLLAGVVGANLRNHPGTVEATLWMDVATTGSGQVFTRERDGYSEANSTRFDLEHSTGARAYVVALHPDDALHAIRVDPGTGEGAVSIGAVAFSWKGEQAQLSGGELRAAVKRLTQLQPGMDGSALSFESTGGDPSLELTVPREITDAMEFRAYAGFGLLMAALAGLSWLLWSVRVDLALFVRQAFSKGDWRLFVLAALAGVVMLSILGAGCDGMCSPRGAGFGMLLLAASLSMAAVGQVALRGLGIDSATGRPRLFLSLLSGQAVFVLYIAVRSTIHAWIPVLPITATELIVLVVASTGWLFRGALVNGAQNLRGCGRNLGWLMIELALLAATCLVIGERELPRLVMLSSDPDTHAYFARQLELYGGVPWWSNDAFHYPMGTGVLGFLWAKLAFLDVRNSITALPLLQTFLAALVLAESFAVRVRQNIPVLLLFLTGLGVTAAGFLVPLYSNYAHMEGAGRQMAIAMFAVVPALLLSRRAGGDIATAVLMLLSLFVLAVLNPVNVVVPLILLAGYGVHQVLLHRRIGWWCLAPVVLVALLLLDPYYFSLIAGSGTPESRFSVDAALAVKPLALVIAQWLTALGRGPMDFLAGNTRFLPAQAPMFFAFAAILVTTLWWLRRWPLRCLASGVTVVAFVLMALWAADALFDALVDDRRFYLLAPYFWLNLAQLKILLVTALVLAVVFAGHLRGLPVLALVAFSATAVSGIALAMHRTQEFMERPRVEYCGSLGCVEPDDLAVLREFETLTREEKLHAGRVLLPNSRHKAHREEWIFPITGTRALPFFDVPNAAFFYYQGDPDFTTANYVVHVCDHFDRQWLREQAITYVFLPTRRGAACLAGMESLPQTDRVILRHGESMILELR